MENEHHNFYEIRIPVSTITGGKEAPTIPIYHDFLMNKIYPAIDKLYSKGLIDTYHFLIHQNLDLRISIPDETKTDAIKNILEDFELPTELHEWDKKMSKIEDEILRLNTEITRLLLQHPNLYNFLGSVIHYPVNQFGYPNLKESEFLLLKAVGWGMTHYVENEGMELNDATLKIKEELGKLLSGVEVKG